MNILKMLAWKNLTKNKRRTFATVIGIIIAVALICFIISFVESFQNSMINITKKTVGNYHIDITDISENEIKTIRDKIIKQSYIDNIGVSQTIGAANYETQNSSKLGIIIEGYDNNALENVYI